MDSLPPEVYSEIVQLLQPTDKRLPRHILPIEIILSHVSTGWRSIAFSDSKSWELVEVYSPKTLPRAEAYISHSANAAINLRIDVYDYEFNHDGSRPLGHQAFIASLTVVLRIAAPRCKSILIFTYHERTAQQLLSALEYVNSPLLQRLRVNVNDTVEDVEEDGDIIKASAIFTGGAESLTFVELETPSFPSFRQLVTLHLHGANPSWFSFEEFAGIAAEATSLENLSLSPNNFFSDWPIHRDSPTIPIPSLRSLRILEDQYPAIAIRLLLALEAPNLNSLWLMTSSTALDVFFDSPQIANRSPKFPELKYLTLESFNMQDTVGFAQAFPAITHIHLPCMLSFFFHLFVEQMLGQERLWPILHTFVLDITREAHAQKLTDGLCRIVSSRRNQNLPVPKVLGDADVLQILKASDLLNETIKAEALTTEAYREPWWVMNHERTMDRIGLL